MAAKLKDYIITAKLQPDGREVSSTVTARSRLAAERAFAQKYNYKAYGIKVRG